MGFLNYQRFADDTFKVEVDSLFNPILSIARTDGGSVSFTGKTVKMDIMTKYGETPVVTLSTGTGLEVSGSTITISKIFTELDYVNYVYEIYNDTDKISIMKGNLVAL